MSRTETNTLPSVNETVYFTDTFQFLGNEGTAKVRKYSTSRGDGDICTGDGGQVLASVSANLMQLNANTIRLRLRYQVWESSYFSKNGAKTDCLYFDAYKDIDVGAYLNSPKPSKNGNVTTKVVKQLTLDTTKEVYYYDYWKTKNERKGWLSYDPRSTFDASWFPNRIIPIRSSSQAWMPTDELKCKIDGSGSELTKVGNIGVQGRINIPLIVKTFTTITTVIDDDVMPGATGSACTMGKGNVTSIPDPVKITLGFGFNAFGKLDGTSVENAVLDIDKLLEYKRITRRDDATEPTSSISGSSIEEYSKKYSESLGVSAKASFFGVTVSNETKKQFEEESYSKSGYEYKTVYQRLIDYYYNIYGNGSPSQLIGFLDADFLRDLNQLTADELVSTYGTHVIVGAFFGKRLDYSMCVQKSLQTLSEASSFSTKTSVEYKPGLGGKKAETSQNEKKVEFLDFAKAMKDIKDPKALAEVYQLIYGSGGSQPTQATKSSAGMSGSGFSATVEYANSSESKSSVERNSCKHEVDGLGGSRTFLNLIKSDYDTYYPKWLATTEGTTGVAEPKFIGFSPDGGIIPLWEIVPAGYRITPTQVRDAVSCLADNYKATPICTKYKTVKKTIELRPKRSSDCEALQGDWEISSQSGKTLSWRLQLEPVNLVQERTVAVCVSFTVYEGPSCNEKSAKSVLQCNGVFDIPRDESTVAYQAISDKLQIVNETMMGNFTGKAHDWIDVTNEIRQQSHNFVDVLGDRVYVHLDGKGDDWDNIGVKCTLQVPVMYYSTDEA